MRIMPQGSSHLLVLGTLLLESIQACFVLFFVFENETKRDFLFKLILEIASRTTFSTWICLKDIEKRIPKIYNLFKQI